MAYIGSPIKKIEEKGLTTTPAIERYKERFKEAKLPIPEEPTEKVGILKKIFGLLQRGETAPAIMAALKEKPILKTYKESIFGREPEKRVVYEDVLTELGWDTTKADFLERGAKFTTGLLMDIFLDPKTYLTFGAGGAIKIATKIGGKPATIGLSKAGQKFVNRVSKEFTEELSKKGIKEATESGYKHAIERLGTEIAMGRGKKYLAKDGLKFMGKEIIPRKVIVMPFRKFDKILEKLPKINKGYSLGKKIATKTIYEPFEKAFRPFKEIERLPVGGNYADEYKFFVRRMTAEERQTIEAIGRKKIGVEKKFGKIFKKEERTVGDIMSEAVETGKKTGFKELDEILDEFKKRHEVLWKEEFKRGMIKGKIPEKKYIRHFLTERARKELTEGKDLFTGLSKSLRTKLKAAEPRQIPGTLKSINEVWQKEYGYKLFEEDFFKAWAVREAEHIKNVGINDFLLRAGEKFGQKFGPELKKVKVFRKATEAKPKRVGYKWKKIEGKWEKVEVLKPAVRAQPAKFTFEYRRVYPETKVVDGIEYIVSKAPQLEGVYFPKPIAKHIDDTYGALTNDETIRGFLKWYDKGLGFWKGTVTGIWLAFHSRNFLGGSFNNWLAGVKTSDHLITEAILAGKEGEIITQFGKKISFKDIKLEALKKGVVGQPGMIDMMRTMNDMLNAGKFSRKLKNAPQFAMEAVENRLRIPLFVRRLKMGESFEEAAKKVFEFHFDYNPITGLTKFERNVMKRLAPFYVWMRNDIPLQLANLIKQPGKYAAMAKTQRDWNRMTPKAGEEEKYMPNWMSEMFFFRLPKEEQAFYLQLDLPLEDLAKLPLDKSGQREIIALLSPVLKYPIERISNRNLYFGSEIYDKNLPEELQTRKTFGMLKILPEPIKKFLGFKEGVKKDYRTGKFEPYYEMDGMKLHTIRTFLGRFYSSFEQALQEDMPILAKLSRLVGGIPIRKFDIKEEKYRREKEFERLLRETATYYMQRNEMPYMKEKKKKIPVY